MIFDQIKWKKQLGNVELDDGGLSFRTGAGGDTAIHIPWSRVKKHQVSPASYPKALLKVNLMDGSDTTFQLPDRPSLERIRTCITQFLQHGRNGAGSPPNSSTGNLSGKKRAFSEVAQSPSSLLSSSTLKNTSFGDLDPTTLAVTRSTVLAAHPNLRQQHHYLVNESKTVTEEDFWKTHQDFLEEEYARMSGVAKAGSTSLLQSHVPAAGKVTLGVEEMRQIFILYPAVHKAYEEKVPLALSDEEFWRKYLESEYFHRDRGRIGTAARNHQPANAKQVENSVDKKKENSGPTMEEQDARAAAVSADDLFSRYEQKLSESNAIAAESNGEGPGGHRRWGTHLAVGQFDLARTLETERGRLLEGPRDNHPPNPINDGKGSRVIEKYNRHWAMVLHPDEAVAGSNLLQVARKSVQDAIPDSDDAKAQGGMDEEFRRLSGFASANIDHANHAMGVGVEDGENYEPLSLHNVEAYYRGLNHTNHHQDHNSSRGQPSSQQHQKKRPPQAAEAALARRHSDFSKVMAAKALAIAKSSVISDQAGATPLQPPPPPQQQQRGVLDSGKCFPPPKLGRELLTALTKKMVEDSRTDAASLEIVNRLPDDFRNRLQAYFRRSSELLRHFFALRRLEEEHRGTSGSNAGESGGGGGSSNVSGGYSQKLSRINSAMASFYREMEEMRRNLPQTETGEMMRKMCLPIMDQLHWAFKLHREGSGGGGGGFVDVEEN